MIATDEISGTLITNGTLDKCDGADWNEPLGAALEPADKRILGLGVTVPLISLRELSCAQRSFAPALLAQIKTSMSNSSNGNNGTTNNGVLYSRPPHAATSTTATPTYAADVLANERQFCGHITRGATSAAASLPFSNVWTSATSNKETAPPPATATIAPPPFKNDTSPSRHDDNNNCDDVARSPNNSNLHLRSCARSSRRLATNADQGIMLSTGACMLPKTEDRRSEDAYFVLPHMLGVADGVGGWREYGIDSGVFSRALMSTCARVAKELVISASPPSSAPGSPIPASSMPLSDTASCVVSGPTVSPGVASNVSLHFSETGSPPLPSSSSPSPSPLSSFTSLPINSSSAPTTSSDNNNGKEVDHKPSFHKTKRRYDPLKVLRTSHDEIKQRNIPGSATICILSAHPSDAAHKLDFSVANLGDSGFIVIGQPCEHDTFAEATSRTNSLNVTSTAVAIEKEQDNVCTSTSISLGQGQMTSLGTTTPTTPTTPTSPTSPTMSPTPKTAIARTSMNAFESVPARIVGPKQTAMTQTNTILLRSKPQQLTFNHPYQLGTDTHCETAADADLYKGSLKAGDVIVMGTDGLFDNLHDHEILDVLAHPAHIASSSPGTLAKRLADLARARAMTATAVDTPWSSEIRKMDPSIEPCGKLDDITVLVSVVTE